MSVATCGSRPGAPLISVPGQWTDQWLCSTHWARASLFVDFLVRHIKGTTHVTDNCLCLHFPERDNLGNIILAVFVSDILNDTVSAMHAEIYIYIRRTYSLGIEKALKQKAIRYRIELGYFQRIGDQASLQQNLLFPAPTWDIMLFCIIDKVGNDQEI